MSLVMGKRSTFEVQCVLCGARYGNAQEHDCPYTGLPHAQGHKEIEKRLKSLEASNTKLVLQVGALLALNEKLTARVTQLESAEPKEKP